jgi:hypothetical protein
MISHTASKIILLVVAAAIFAAACGFGPKRDRFFWKKNRMDIITLSEKVLIISNKTGFTTFTMDSVGPDFKRQIAVTDASAKYPELADDIKQIGNKIKLIRYHWITLKPSYIAIFKSGGLGTDTVLLRLLTDDGLNEFAKDFKEYGLVVQETMELEKNWLFVYTD